MHQTVGDVVLAVRDAGVRACFPVRGCRQRLPALQTSKENYDSIIVISIIVIILMGGR